MTEQHWSPRLVAAHMSDAAETWQRSQHAQQQDTNAPAPMPDGAPAVAVGAAVQSELALSPPPAAIEQMNQAMAWLQWLEPADQRLIWERALGWKWKAVADAASVEKTTAWRKHSLALAVIAARLNAAEDATPLKYNAR